MLQRFPLLQLLEFSDGPGCDPVRLPHFVGLLATLLTSANKPCCIVLPDAKGVALAVSTLVAVSRLRNEFPTILKTHAASVFRKGVDNVLVHPSDLVYRYDGFFNDTLFRLGILDRKDGRSLPVQEIARLEKTMRKRPKGALNSDLGQSRCTVLGALLDIKITLNRNFLQNYVLVLGPRKAFLEGLERWSFQTQHGDEVVKSSLKDELPFGRVTEGGGLCFLDNYIAAGEPLIAIASRAEDLAAHCAAAGRFTKEVLIDDIDYITRDLQSYDAITENQRTVILASDAERDSVRMLQARGCEVWRLTPDEMLLGVESEQQNVPLRQLLRKASRVRDLVISELPCGEGNLDRAAAELKIASDAVSSIDNGTVRDLLYSLFRIIMFCAEYLGQDSVRFVSAADNLLKLAEQRLETARVWLSAEVNERIKSALAGMHAAISDLSQSGLTPKGKLLLENLKKAGSECKQAAIVVARSETDCTELRQWLDNEGIKTETYLIGELPENRNFGQVLVLSWPRSERFDRLVHQYLTDDLRMLAYPFEGKWLNQYQKRYKRSLLSGISTRQKMRLIGLSSEGTGVDDSEKDFEEISSTVKFDLPEEQFLVRRKSATALDLGEQEESIEAYYVGFAGPTFACLTDGHDLPVINSYISGDQANPGKIPLRSVDQLKVGDYVVFRESGDSDIIRFLAEDEIGKGPYEKLRSMAGRWRTALRKLGADPRVVLERLRRVEFSRRIETVRSWLVDESRICPQDINDVRKIAYASQDEELLALLPEVERARDRLMSLHISAGSRLTELLLKELPGKIGQLGHGETELDLGVGNVWIVHVEEIDRSPSTQRHSQVNRLLWDEGER